jgi:hypothetical protein
MTTFRFKEKDMECGGLPPLYSPKLASVEVWNVRLSPSSENRIEGAF